MIGLIWTINGTFLAVSDTDIGKFLIMCLVSSKSSEHKNEANANYIMKVTGAKTNQFSLDSKRTNTFEKLRIFTMCFSIKVINHTTLEVIDKTMSGRLGKFDEKSSEWFNIAGTKRRVRFQTFGTVSLFMFYESINFKHNNQLTISIVKGQSSLKCSVDTHVNNYIGSSKLINFHKAHEWLHTDGSLRFQVTFKNGIRFSTFEATEQYKRLPDMQRHIRSLDVKLVTIEGRKILASKKVLSTYSPVFDAMFDSSNGWLECDKNEVKIDDIEYEVLNQLVKAMYVGMSAIVDMTFALKLYVAADKYAIDFVMTRAEDFIVINITEDNVIQILSFGQIFNSKELMSMALEYIVSETKTRKISSLPYFEQLSIESLALLVDTLHSRQSACHM